MAYACRVRLAVVGPSLALVALFAAVPSAYPLAASAVLATDAPRSAQPPQSPQSPQSTQATHSARPPRGRAAQAGLAGTTAGEGRPHPGRDADQEELDAAAGHPPGVVPQEPSPDDPAASRDSTEREDPAGPWDPSVPRDPMSPWRSAPGEADQQDGSAAMPTDPASPFPPGRGANGMPSRPDEHRPDETGPGETAPGESGPQRTEPEGPPVAPHATVPPYEQTTEPPSGRVLRVLPFGTGLALLGAGIGVLAVRLRRR